MNTLYLLMGSAIVIVLPDTVATAQSVDMPGMQMPPKAKPTTKKAAKKAPVQKVSHAQHEASAPAHSDMDHEAMPMPEKSHPTATGADHSASPMAGMPMPAGAQSMRMDAMSMSPPHHEMPMTGGLGPYPMQRESSGTAWQPDNSEHAGLMSMSGDWTLMAHGVLNLVYDHQSGPRGDDKAFASGMIMGMARRPIGSATVKFKAMLSPDPLMGPKGYPLLLASGETANGRDRLIDRQHPHDLFMELSGSVSQPIGPKSALFLYAGLPGEPAFGPPSFMHREAILDSPEAPITHHWLDSTHITFGVVTAGIVLDRFKLEASRFNGREPDQHRWNIETGPLDSTAVRVSWNPTDALSLQGSWGHFADPEQLEPGVDQKRWSASALYARQIAAGWKFAGTLAWGRKAAEGHKDDGFVAEASLKHAGWTAFGRGEITENRELTDVVDGPAYRVGKVSVGAVRDFSLGGNLSVGAGGLLSLNFVPGALAPAYGGDNPDGAVGFIRLTLD